MKSLSIFLILAVFPAALLFAQEDAPALDPAKTREVIRQWVKTERLISEEKTAWQVEKKQMQMLLDLYQKELTLLNEELEQAGGAAESVDKDKEKLEAELKRYRTAQRLLTDTLARLLPRVRTLITRFPKPLQDELSADIDALNAPDALGQPRDVLRSTISVLMTAGRFNRSVTLTEEIRDVSGGKRISVDVLYLGLARGYYAARSGDKAGVGVPQKAGWKWTGQAEIADDVRQAIAVYKKDKQPQLLKLPVAIDKEIGK